MSNPETPSPKPKEPGSNKRIRMDQSGPSSERSQPDGPPIVEDNGPDVNPVTTNPDNNPSSRDIPAEPSNKSIHDHLLTLRILETKHTKLDHHLQFLSQAIDEEFIPNGLAWNISVNVMEPNETINAKIKEHIKQSAMQLMEIIRDHYDQVETKIAEDIQKTDNTIDNLKDSSNEQTIQKSKEAILKETTELTNKLNSRRQRKIQNLKNPRPRPRPMYTNYQQQLNYPRWNQQPPRPPPPSRPPPLMSLPPYQLPPDPPVQQQQQQQQQQQYIPRTYQSQQQQPTYQTYTHANGTANTFGEIIKSVGFFVTNLTQQSQHLLSSLNQLTYQFQRN